MAVGALGSRQIAVAGNLGAGKTTLVDGLCTQLGWTRSPPRRPDVAYVQRIHSDPHRWSFEAQLNFLLLKAAAIREAELNRRSTIIDRSIYEDCDVMARSWAERYWDDAARATYHSCAEMLISGLPVPDAVVYCRCRPDVCAERRGQRARLGVATYDPQWVTRLDDLYRSWTSDFSTCPLLELDTESHDVRDAGVVREIISDLEWYFAPRPQGQTMLFDLSGSPPPDPLFEEHEDASPLRMLRPLNSIPPHRTGGFAGSPGFGLISQPIQHPAAYIAAPFTAMAVVPEPLTNELRLPVDERLHGVIPNDYRRRLERVVAAVEGQGLSAVLPHRDVNRWGRRSLSPQQVAQSCIDLVRECDVFVGILGDSYGAHVEAGVALALRKPCVFFEVGEFGQTFVGSGLAHTRGVRRESVERLEDVAARIAYGPLLPAIHPPMRGS